MDKDDSFFHRLSAGQQEQYKEKIEEWTKINIPPFLNNISETISIDQEHLKLVRLCASAFSSESFVSTETGYEFYCAEPLIEFSSEGPGNSSFDLLIYSESANKAIFVECKSSITDVKEVYTQITEAKLHVEKRLSYISERVGGDLQLENCEFVLCATDSAAQRVIHSITQQQRRRDRAGFSFEDMCIWKYLPHVRIMQLSPECNHQDAQLSRILRRGTQGEIDGIRIDLPYCLTTHPFSVIREAVIGQCYGVQFARRKTIRDPKIIDRNLLMSQMMKSISLSAAPAKKIELVKEKMDSVISYGEQYSLFSEVKGDTFRINCRGERPDKVKESLTDKFFDNWSYRRARLMAKEQAEEEMARISAQKDLTFFNDVIGSKT
jgi:hypothetical protein